MFGFSDFARVSNSARVMVRVHSVRAPGFAAVGAQGIFSVITGAFRGTLDSAGIAVCGRVGAGAVGVWAGVAAVCAAAMAAAANNTINVGTFNSILRAANRSIAGH